MGVCGECALWRTRQRVTSVCVGVAGVWWHLCVCVCGSPQTCTASRRLVGMVEERRQSGRVGYYGDCSVDCVRFQLSRRSGTFRVKYPVPDLGN